VAITNGWIRAISISTEKGMPKGNVPQAELKADFGLVGDAHAGSGHRQVSLLEMEAIEELRRQGAEISPGDFAENLTVQGLDLSALKVGHRLRVGGTVELEVTQLGKRCHGRCRIFEKLGDCIMPRQGVFARVVTGGRVQAGDPVIVDSGFRSADSTRTGNPQAKPGGGVQAEGLVGGVSGRASGQTPQGVAANPPGTATREDPKSAKVAILTVSDSSAQGRRPDASGPAAREILQAAGYTVAEECILPDDRDALARQLTRWADEGRYDVVFTTGGTGLGPRDVTPEATGAVCDRLVPGLGELMRGESLKETRNAALSRGIAGMRGQTLVVNLPGSPRAVRECLEAILDILPHALEMMHGGGHGGQ
jgi:molybdopterin adenylyltransferase